MRTFAPPPGDATAARLELTRGRRHLTIQVTEIHELCRAVFAGVAPRVAADHGRVRIAYPRFTLAGPLRHRAHRAKIELNPALPWTLTFTGGVGDSAMDLRGLDLSGFEVTGGASNLELLLPAPRGDVRVCIDGGASRLTLLRPTDVPAMLWVAGGASRLTFDGERYGAVGGVTRLETHGNNERNRYEIEVLGGASDLTIAEVG